MFSVRIVNVDHYLCPPLQGLDITYSQFRGSQVKQVPVIRIFGSTPTGIKTCLHVHGVFPYLLVPYDGSDDIQRLMYIIASSLDKALNISLGISNSNKQHVFKIVQVSGSPFYGYHEVEHQFLKIFFYNPSMVKRATDLLQNGAICNKVFQPHEAHVSFILQFFIDYNLYGMSFINLKHVLFRRSVDEQPEINETGFEIPLRVSRCEIEVDAIAMDIQNKLDISEKVAINPGLAAIWEEEKQRKKEENTIFESVESQPRLNIKPTLSEVLLKDKLRNTLVMQDKSSSLKTTPQSLIPYPLETQEGCDILNASALNTHCISPIVIAKPDNILNESIIDEDVILSLTSQSDETLLLNSQDQMLLNVLQNLAEDKEEREEDKESSCKLQYNVEDDSILGSQLLTNVEEEEDLLEACQQVEDVEFQHNTKEITEQEQTIESWDDNHWEELSDEDIPQMDGTEDLLDKTKPDKHKSHIRNLTEGCEMNGEDDDSCSVIEIADVQSTTMWPIVGIGKEVDRCDEVFSDSNESINFVERTDADVYENSDVIKINIENNFDHILRGDPSFMSQTITSSEDTSFYSAKENFTCSWNNSLSLQPSDNSESDDYLLAKLSDASKPEDNLKSEYTTIVGSDLSDNTDKNLQFNDNLVPLLNIPECDEIVYNKFVDEVQPIYSDEMIGKTQIMDIFRENISYQLESKIQNSEEIQNNADKETTIQQAKSNRMSMLHKKVKDHNSPRKTKSNDVNNIKRIKIKFKFPVKGEINKSTRKLCFVNKQATLDLSEDNVLNYLRKLEKLKQFYLSRRASGTSKLNVEAIKLTKPTRILKENLKVKEAQNNDFVQTSLNKYKLRKCFVLLERLQLNSDPFIIKTSTDSTKTNTSKKIINKLEVLQSRPFSTEILKSNILPNSKSKIKKNILENKVIKVSVEEAIKRDGVKNIFKKKHRSQTECISKKMRSNHNRIKKQEHISKMKHNKCKKKSTSKDYSIDLDRKKICLQNEKYNHESFKTNLTEVNRSSTDLNKIDFTQSIFKMSNFNDSHDDMIDNQLHKINKNNRIPRSIRKESKHYGEENCKDSKILNSRDNIDFFINNEKGRQINNFGLGIETKLVSTKNTCNEKKGGNTHDINSFTNKNNVNNNISKQITNPSMENSRMSIILDSNIDTLNTNSEHMEIGNKTLHKKRNRSKHTELKNKTEANMINYSKEVKNEVDDNKNNNSKLNEKEMKTHDNTRDDSKQSQINKKAQINKLDNSEHMEIEKQSHHKRNNNHYDEKETKDRKSHYLKYAKIKEEMQSSKSDTSEHITINSKPNNSQQEDITKACKVKHRKQCNKKNNSEQIKRDKEMQYNKSNNTELIEIEKDTHHNKSKSLKHLEIVQKTQDNKRNNSHRQDIENKIKVKKSNNVEHKKIKKEIQASERNNSEHVTTNNKSNNYEHKKIETKVQDSTLKSHFEHELMEIEMKTQEKINHYHCQIIEKKTQDKKNNNLENVKIKIDSTRDNPEQTKIDSKSNYSQHNEIEVTTKDGKKKKLKLMEIEIIILDNIDINSQHKQIELKTQDNKGNNSYFKEIENNIQDNKNKNLEHMDIIQKTQDGKRNNSHHHKIERKAEDTKSNYSKHPNIKNEIKTSRRDNSENKTVHSKSNNSQHKEIESKAEDNKSNSEYLEVEMKTQNNKSKNLENIEKKSNNSGHLEQNKKTQNIKRKHPKYKVFKKKTQDNMTNNFEHMSINQKMQVNKNNNSEHIEIENKIQGDVKIRVHKCNKQVQVHHNDAYCEIPVVIETNMINNSTIISEGSQIISNNNKRNLVCSASKPLKIPKVSHCKIKERRKRMKRTNIQFLDGTVDSMSSSSDESVDTVKPEVNSDVKIQTPLKKQHPSTSTKTPTRRYERLNIQIKKSPKTDKTAGIIAKDCKLNSAFVKLVRNKDIEQMLGIEEPVFHSSSLPKNRNLGDLKLKKVIDKSATEISGNTKMKERHVSHPTELKSKFSTLKTSKTSVNETASGKVDQESVNIVVDKQFLTCANSVFSSSKNLLRPSEETTAGENSNIHRFIEQTKNKEDLELNTSLRKCDRSLPVDNYSLGEPRVCVRRLSPHLIAAYGEPVPKQKKLMDTDSV